MPSVMNHSFAQVPAPTLSRSQFDRSHGHKTTINSDRLYPVLVDEILPGDTIRLNPTIFARMSTPIYPIMDNLFVDTFFFSVPMRLVWDNWDKFLGAQDDPGDSIDFTIPQEVSTAITGYAEGSIHDYFGIPPGVPDFSHSALPLRAYNLIYNEWFRDQNLQDKLTMDRSDGPDTTGYAIRLRGKRHDYFTSCLPWPQKSDTAVSMPLGTEAPITGLGLSFPTTAPLLMPNTVWTDETSGTPYGWQVTGAAPAAGTTNAIVSTDSAIGVYPRIYADLSQATAATINALRLAVTTQQFLERDARGGTRINEIILSHFGVVTPDARVQRPEYLGGSTNPVNINTVPQTSETSTTPQGTLAAFGTFSGQGGGFNKSFTEHCILIGLINVRADLTYQAGVERMWTRQTRYDFFWPEFANIGEQAVLQQEIELTDPAAGTNENVFGYQERGAEYRFKPSRISGAFRSTAATSLDPWHLSQELSSPALNASFIKSNTPMDRVEAVPSEPDFIVDCYFDMKHIRPMPTYGTPGLARF